MLLKPFSFASAQQVAMHRGDLPELTYVSSEGAPIHSFRNCGTDQPDGALIGQSFPTQE
jgi:hypothetical protein